MLSKNLKRLDALKASIGPKSKIGLIVCIDNKIEFEGREYSKEEFIKLHPTVEVLEVNFI